MTIVHFAAAYGALGVIAAIVWGRRRAAVDAALLFGLWPIYAPVLLLGGDPRERELLDALRRAAATPLGGVLPDAATGRALASRLRGASARLREIDAVLARPDFDLAIARARVAELAGRSASACAVSTAELRVQTVERVHRLRHRFAAELDEVGELIAQLVAQAELVRFAGTTDSAGDLVRELVARVEGLDDLMATEADPVCSPAGAANPGGR